MRAVLQRVLHAKVAVNGTIISTIGPGWLILLAVHKDDQETDLRYMVDKTLNLRGFPDRDGKMNLSIQESGGSLLVVSQFTLYGDCRKGRRPSFTESAGPQRARQLYEQYAQELRLSGLTVAMGEFQAHMVVELSNDGPVTFVLDSSKIL